MNQAQTEKTFINNEDHLRSIDAIYSQREWWIFIFYNIDIEHPSVGTYLYKVDPSWICPKSTPSSASTDLEVTSNIHVAGL